MRTVAREEALKVETAAMEFMGAVTELPTNLQPKDKGHFYKISKAFTLPEGITKQINESVEGGWLSSYEKVVYVNLSDTNVPQTGYCHLNFTGDPNFISDVKLITYYDDIDGDGNPIIAHEYTSINSVGAYSCYYGVPTSMEITLQNYNGDGEGQYWFDDYHFESAVFSTILPEGMAGKTVKVGDSIVWDGYAWYVIPSGDDIEDTHRPIAIFDKNNQSIGSVTAFGEEFKIKAGDNIAITRDSQTKAFEIAAIIPEVVHATMEKYGTVIGYVESQTIGEEVVTKNMIGMADGKITEVSTDLLVNGFKTLILNGGTATV